MAKYSYEFKLQVVQAYLDGEGGYKPIMGTETIDLTDLEVF